MLWRIEVAGPPETAPLFEAEELLSESEVPAGQLKWGWPVGPLEFRNSNSEASLESELLLKRRPENDSSKSDGLQLLADSPKSKKSK